MADKLEPAFLLAAQVLAPGEAGAGLALLAGALQPEADLDAQAEQAWCERGLVLKQLKGGGWSLRAHLTDETGQLLHDALVARRTTHPLGAPAAERGPADGAGVLADTLAGADDKAGEDDAGADDAVRDAEGADDATRDEGADDAVRDAEGDDPGQPDDAPPDPADPGALDRYGTSGGGLPFETTGPREERPAVEGAPLPSAPQRDHDALTQLLDDVVHGRPAVTAALTVTCRLDALHGRPGAPPGSLWTRSGPVPLAPAALARLACDARLSAVLLDTHGRPVAASGEHRHATRRKRRAMHAAWGRSCAVNGCGLPGVVPHHVVPFALSGETALRDLAPVCAHHHHDVHEGHRTLRLRDGRLVDGRGWVDPAWR